MNVDLPSPTKLPPRVLLLVAALVPIVALSVLELLKVPLGKPGTLVYPYSPFEAVRLTRIAFALFPVALLAISLLVAAGERTYREPLAVALLALGMAGMGVWSLTSAPKWQRQNFFNMVSPSHDGAFVCEAERVREIGVGEYLRTFASRAGTPPAELKGTRVISNPPAVTLIATACDAAVRNNAGLRDALAAIAIDDPNLDSEDQQYAAHALLFAVVLIAMWVGGGLALYAAARVFEPPHVAAFVAACAAVTPMTLLFTPGKDAAQLLTVALPLGLWLAALVRKSDLLSGLAGAAVILTCCVSLVHAWIALAVIVATFWAGMRCGELRRVLRATIGAIAGVLVTGVALKLCAGYDLIAASAAIARAQAAITRGPSAMPLVWQMLGVPLFMLFAGPALWFLVLSLQASRAVSRRALFGRTLALTSILVMLLTVGFTNIETPRLWIPFAVLLTFGLTISAPWIEGDSKTVARLLALVVAIQALVSAYQWSKMDMRETEMRLLESPAGGARLFD